MVMFFIPLSPELSRRFNLKSSTLIFQTYSNKHSVVKLTSHMITLEDSRPASGNAFPLVVTHRDEFLPDTLQVEVLFSRRLLHFNPILPPVIVVLLTHTHM